MFFQFYMKPEGKMGVYYVSEQSKEIFGLDDSKLEVFFEEFYKRIPHNEKQLFFDSIIEAVQKVSRWDYEGRFMKDDGKQVFFKGTSLSERRENELIYNGILLDITEKKAIEEQIKKNEATLNSIFTAAPIGMAFTKNRIIMKVTKVLCDIVKYTEEELLGKDARMFYLDEEEYKWGRLS